MEPVTLDHIRAAASRIAGLARITPVRTSGSFNRRAGVEAFFKCENLQRGGAFKIRGAANFIYSIPEADRARGVVAFSSGNHAQAVAIAARSIGMNATLVMPSDAPAPKLAATRSHGPRIIQYDRLTEDREAIGRRIADESGATLVPPFDHPWIIAGQGTAALELLEQVNGLDALVVCLGGGGLLSGCATAARALAPRLRVFGVEPELANDYWLSRRAGRPVTIAPPETIADGLRATTPGRYTFPIVQSLAEDILLVSEDEIRAAMSFLLSRAKMLVEPSGAVAAAAVMSGKLPPGLRRVGVLLSGGNADIGFLATLPADV